MPLLTPKARGNRFETNASEDPPNATSTWGTVLTSDTVAHTLPTAYTEIIASTSFDTEWVNVTFSHNFLANTRTDSLVNIYVGAASSEQLLIPNLLAGWVGGYSDSEFSRTYGFPLRIPAGSRLSGKHQSVRTSTGVTCAIELIRSAGGGWTGTKVEAVGADAASSRGTSVTPVTTPTEGTLTSIGTNTYEWGFIQPMLGGNYSDTSINGGVMLTDIAAGSSSANLITGLENFVFYADAAEYTTPRSGGRYCLIPASTTLYLRAEGSAATVEVMDFCIYGVY